MKNIKQGKYLDQIKSLDKRLIFTKIRLNSSKINKFPYNQSAYNCDTCEKIADVYHIFLDCSKYKLQQMAYMKKNGFM